MRAGHVFAALAERLPRNAIVIEESPSTRPELIVRLPARESLGALSPAMGGLGFALPAAIGLRMARPDRPVVAIVGDGSSLYSIQALWSAAHYGAGVLFVILANGGYAIMDRLAEQSGGTAPWPGFDVDVAGIARALGCPARAVARARRAAGGAGRGAARPGRPRRAAAARGRRRPRSDVRAMTASGTRFRSQRRDASEQVAFEIRRYLAARDLRPGERLGTEQELAAEFGVSRPTLREGLRLLASSHLIRATQGPGGGIFVASTQSEGMRRNVSESIAVMLETDDVSLTELVEARISLEVPLAGLAAQHATDTTAEELLAAIAEAEGNDPASDVFRIADTRFHRVIASAARNELLRAFTSWTLDVLQPSLIDTIGASIDGDAILRSAPRHPARHPPAAARRRAARDAPSPRLPAGARHLLRHDCDREPEERPVKAALMREYHRPLEFVERPMPEIAHPADVVVRIGGAGVCATDLHAIEGLMEHIGVRLPRVLGHENAGWVEEVGDGVTTVAKGDAVLVYPPYSCGLCVPCRRGNDMHCAHHQFTGLTVDGGFADYVVVSERSLAAPARRRRAGGRRTARRRGAHGVPRGPPDRPPRGAGHDGGRDRRRRRRAHRAPAPARARLERDRRDRHRRATPRAGDRARRR